jgi:hypothetical protein
MKSHPVRLLAVLLCLAGPAPMPAWDYAGHRAVNLVALRSLPAEFPAFVKTAEARERIAFLAGEPDRWRNTADHTLKHCNEPDHFLDLEYLANFGLTPETVSPFRYEFISQLAARPRAAAATRQGQGLHAALFRHAAVGNQRTLRKAEVGLQLPPDLRATRRHA